MSVVVYNSITLPYAFATDFKKVPVRDPLGDTDWCKLRFEITVQCLVNVNYLPLMAPGLVNSPTIDNAAAVLNQIRDRLLPPRKRLSYTFNGVEMIPQIQDGITGSVDAENGPKVQECGILQLTTETFLLSFSVVAHYWETRGDQTVITDNKPGNNVLYNRWTETQEIDGANFSRRVREGVYAIRSDNVDGQLADQIRGDLAVVGIPHGFLRESSKYTVTEDGLRIKYQVADKEQFRMPPRPAFKAKGHYYETLGKTGAKIWGQILLQLEGDKLTSQETLIQQAVSIGSSYLFRRMQKLGQSWTYLENAGARFEFYENKVEFLLRYFTARTPQKAANIPGTVLIHGPIQGGINTSEIFKSITCNVPGSEPGTNYTPRYLNRGTAGPNAPNLTRAGLLLRACAYYDPSLRNNIFNTATGQYEQGREVGTAGLNP